MNFQERYQPKVISFPWKNEIKNLTKLSGIPKATKVSVKLREKEPLLVRIISEKREKKEFKVSISSYRKMDKVYEVFLDISSNWAYQVGDSFGVSCTNHDALVLPLLKRLGLEPSQGFTFELGRPVHAPSSFTAKQAIAECIDLHSFPKKMFFRIMGDLAGEQEEQRDLYYLSSTLGKQAYNDLRNLFPTVLELLLAFPSVKITLDQMFQFLGPLQPRYYSVSQSSKVIGKNKVSFAFNVFESDNPPHIGLCTGSIRDILEGESLSTLTIFPRIAPVSFGLNLDHNLPVLMIANGTGLAPFIGFAQELQHEQRTGILLYGHRTKEDKIYVKELEEFTKEGVLRVIECLSRVEGPQFKYVQHALSDLDELIFNSVIYICGSADMGKGVHEELIKLTMDRRGFTMEEAFKFWAGRANSKLYMRELW
jgi:methionine synthase reductase